MERRGPSVVEAWVVYVQGCSSWSCWLSVWLCGGKGDYLEHCTLDVAILELYFCQRDLKEYLVSVGFFLVFFRGGHFGYRLGGQLRRWRTVAQLRRVRRLSSEDNEDVEAGSPDVHPIHQQG